MFDSRLNHILAIAKEACADARKRVLKSSTKVLTIPEKLDADISIETLLEIHKREINHANIGIKDIRNLIDKEIKKDIYAFNARLAYVYADRLLPHETIQAYKTLAKFEAEKKFCNKYSLGNCHELASLALNYVLDKEPNILVEQFTISNGDHEFLVLNRRKPSNSTDPSSWGKEAVICDPWANKIFQTSDYLAELRNFIRDPESKLNETEEFDLQRHSLSLKFSSEEILELKKLRHKVLQAYLLKKKPSILKTLAEYKDCLTREAEKLTANDPLKILLQTKIQQIDAYMQKLNNYQENFLKDAVLVMTFTPVELAALKSNKNLFTTLRNLTKFVNEDIEKNWSDPLNNCHALANVLYNEIPKNQRRAFALEHISEIELKSISDLKTILSTLDLAPINELRFLIACKTKINDPFIWLDLIKEYLQKCIKTGNEEALASLELLFGSKCINPNTSLKNGISALELAIRYKNPDIVEALLTHGADPNEHVGEYTPLGAAITWYSPDIISLLLAHGAKTDVPVSIESPKLPAEYLDLVRPGTKLSDLYPSIKILSHFSISADMERSNLKKQEKTAEPPPLPPRKRG